MGEFILDETFLNLLKLVQNNDGLGHQISTSEIENIDTFVEFLNDNNLGFTYNNHLLIKDKGRVTNSFLEYFYENIDGYDLLANINSIFKQDLGISLINNICHFILKRLTRIENIKELWFCSPWIIIVKENRPYFETIFKKINKKNFYIICKPLEETKDRDFREATRDTLNWLYDLGFENILLHEKLHAKIYLCKTFSKLNNQFQYRQDFAIVGSENLTMGSNFELGILIEGIRDRLIQQIYNTLNDLLRSNKYKKS